MTADPKRLTDLIFKVVAVFAVVSTVPFAYGPCGA